MKYIIILISTHNIIILYRERVTVEEVSGAGSEEGGWGGGG